MPKPGAMPKPRDSGARACRRQLLYAAASRAASETVNEGHARAYSLGMAPALTAWARHLMAATLPPALITRLTSSGAGVIMFPPVRDRACAARKVGKRPAVGHRQRKLN